MSIFTRFKNIFIILVVVAAAFVAYSVFFTGGNTGALTVQEVDPSQTAVEQELIALLLQLKSIKLDPSLFDNADFQSLQDFSQGLVPEPVGRPNPFSPLQ